MDCCCNGVVNIKGTLCREYENKNFHRSCPTKISQKSILRDTIPEIPHEFNSLHPKQGKLIRALLTDAHEKLQKNRRHSYNDAHTDRFRPTNSLRESCYSQDDGDYDASDDDNIGMFYQHRYELPTVSSMLKAKNPLFLRYRSPTREENSELGNGTYRLKVGGKGVTDLTDEQLLNNFNTIQCSASIEKHPCRCRSNSSRRGFNNKYTYDADDERFDEGHDEGLGSEWKRGQLRDRMQFAKSPRPRDYTEANYTRKHVSRKRLENKKLVGKLILKRSGGLSDGYSSLTEAMSQSRRSSSSAGYVSDTSTSSSSSSASSSSSSESSSSSSDDSRSRKRRRRRRKSTKKAYVIAKARKRAVNA